MADELARQLAAFPFRKLMPESFRLEIAGLTPKQLDERQVRAWVSTHDIPKVLKAIGSSKLLRSFPHLDYVYLEVSASQLIMFDGIDVVNSVWSDDPARVEACVVDRSDPRSFPLATRTNGRAR